MKKYILYTIIAVMLAGMMPACKKMLDVPDNLPGQLVTDLVFTDSIGAVNGVVGIYNQAFIGPSPMNGNLSIYPSLSADDLISDPYYESIYNNQLTPGDDTKKTGMTGDIWNALYGSTMIYQANTVLEALAASKNLSVSLKNQLTGECEFVRALSYFYLTNLYGAVPLAITSDYKVNNRLPRSTADEVYEQIIKDLTDASSRLSANYPSAGRARPNKYVALALLSRVYLYLEQWEKADSIASIIINAGPYSIETLDRVFVAENNEAIWHGLITGYYNYATGDGSTFVPYSSGQIPTYQLRDTLLNSFETGDLRKTQWLASNTVNGIQYYYPYKYKNASGRQVNGRVEAQIAFRLAEQYLIRSEARIKLGNLDGAADDIFAVRVRAALARPTIITTDALMNALIHERQTEFFCEWGHRWLDLKRWGIVNATMNAVKPGKWPADGHSAFYPVSYEQMMLNPGWIQNPGY